VVHWVSSNLSFFLSASIAATYIFTARTCTRAIITLEPCALNVEFQPFHTEILMNFRILCGYRWKWGRGWKEAQTQGNFRDKLYFIVTCAILITMGTKKDFVSIMCDKTMTSILNNTNGSCIWVTRYNMKVLHIEIEWLSWFWRWWW